MRRNGHSTLFARLLHGLFIGTGAVGMTFAVFLVLPMIQAIAKGREADLELVSVDTANLPPPPPPPLDEETQDEPEPEEKPPELMESNQPLDLAQLELALNPGFGEGWGGDFAVKLEAVGESGEVDALFALSADQEPRAIYQPDPVLSKQARRKAPGTVYVIFTVDEQGRVQNPKVESSTDPVFERPVLAAVKKWRYEPGKRNGKPVPRPARIPITIPGP